MEILLESVIERVGMLSMCASRHASNAEGHLLLPRYPFSIFLRWFEACVFIRCFEDVGEF